MVQLLWDILVLLNWKRVENSQKLALQLQNLESNVTRFKILHQKSYHNLWSGEKDIKNKS
jgi:hypothetical protein